MSDFLSTPSGIDTTEQSEKSSTQTLDSLLQKGGIQVTPVELSHINEVIQRNPSLLESIKKDILVIEKNPNEKSRFETMYIKGLGQVVEIGGKKMSFAEIAALPETEKDDLLDNKLSTEQSKQYLEWQKGMQQAANQRIEVKKNVEQAANQRIEVKKNVEQAANQTERKLDVVFDLSIESVNKKLVEKVRSLMDPGANEFVKSELRQLQSDPERSPITQDLIRQGANIEDIKSGKLNSTIEAYIISNNERILAPKDPQKALEFSEVVRQMRENIGVPPTRENIAAFASSKVLGPDRDRIESAMYVAADTGKYDRIKWDPDTREIIFENNNGERRIIDTTSIPPVEKIMKNGLSIHHEVVIEKTDPLTEERKNIEGNIRNNIAAIRDTPYLGAIMGNVESFDKEFDNAKKGTNTLDILRYSREGVRKKGEAIYIKIQELEKNGEQAEVAQLTDGLTMIRRQLEHIDDLQQKYRTIALLEKQKNGEKGYDAFDTNAKNNLDWLIYNRFDRMGPDATEILSRIIAEINRERTANNQIDLSEPLDTGVEGPNLIGILRKLGGTPDTLTDGEKLPIFQKNMSAALVFPSSDSRSIEAMIRN